MGEVTAGFIMGVVVTVLAGMLVYQIWNGSQMNECARKHNVFQCEYVGQWQPAPKQD